MQAALITNIPAATNSIEPSAETGSSGQGLRISSTLQPQKPDSLFTTILRQGIAVKMPPSAEPSSAVNDILLTAGTDGVKKTGKDEPVDVSSLLMQMMVMNASVQMQPDGGNNSGTGDSNGEAVNVISAVISENPELSDAIIKGLDDSSIMILQNGGNSSEPLMASDLFQALAAAKNAGENGELMSGVNPESKVKAVLESIAEALKNGLEQSAEITSAQAADAQAAAAEIKAATDALAAEAGVKGADPGKNEQFKETALNSGGVKTSGQAVNSFTAAGAGTAIKGAGNETSSNGEQSGSSLKGQSESIYGVIEGLGKNKDDDTGIATESVSQIMIGPGVKSETMAEKTSAVERALNRFTDDLRSFTGGTQEIKIVLEPESLGVLIISVIKTENGISAKIKSEDKEVAAIITDHLQKLISSMQNKGITVDDVDVIYSQPEQNNSFTQQGFSQARDEASKGYYTPDGKNSDDTAGADLWQNFYSGETGGDTTVDYRI